MKPFLLIETGAPLPSLRRHGSFGHWIRVAAGLHGREVRHCHVAQGEKLPARQAFAGALVTGSGAMVTERADWSERSAQWLAEAAQAGLPLFGICYGHQLIAHGLGGKVDFNPKGREMGTVPVATAVTNDDDVLFAGVGRGLLAHATHLQTVVTPPPGARILAVSALDDCQAFRWGEATWGVQFHPEFSTGIMRGYIQARSEALAKEGTCHRSLEEEVRPTPLARRIIRKFIHVARQRARNEETT